MDMLRRKQGLWGDLQQLCTSRTAQHSLLQILWHPGNHRPQLLKDGLHNLRKLQV